MRAHVRTLGLRAAIAAMGIIAIIGTTGALPRADAEPTCGGDPAVQCVDQAQAVRPDPHAGKHLTITCSPARLGAHCMKQWLP
jgi:hypothetical protein